RVIYQVPVLNLFRVPARHMVEISFAIAMLAGRGATLLETARDTPRVKLYVAAVGAGIFVLTVAAATVFRPANFQMFRQAPVSVLRARELFVPILMAALSAVALWFFVNKRKGASLLLLAVLVLDLSLWGQFSGWYMSVERIPKDFWGVPESVKILNEKAGPDRSSYRILTSHQTFDPESPARTNGWVIWTEPDLYSMFGISNAAGYDGFGLDRYSQLAGQMKLWGELTDPNASLRSNSREMDILNVRYLVARTDSPENAKADVTETNRSANPAAAFPPATHQYDSFRFAENDLDLTKIVLTKRLQFTVPPIEIDRVALLSNLSWADAIPDNTVVGRLRLTTRDQRVVELPLRAGIETGDWAYDRPDIRQRIRHKHPAIASSYEVTDSQFNYQGHRYVASVALPERLSIVSGELILEPNANAPDLFLSVFRISLADTAGEKFYPLTREMVSVGDRATSAPVAKDKSQRWQLLAKGKHFDIFENTRSLPRAWLASRAEVQTDARALMTIQTGLMPDGSKWEPMRTAIVEDSESDRNKN
ncbi:MAG: hypothetical protein DMF69_04765, partial [Acidobacteria bacterium]